MTTIYKNLKITSTDKRGQKVAPLIDNSNYHIITVTNIDTKKFIRFEFWSSMASPRIITNEDLLQAFECFVNDAVAGAENESFEDFCGAFGYDVYDEDIVYGNYDKPETLRRPYNKKALKAHKGCLKAREQAQKVIDGCLWEFAGELYDTINN